MDDVSSALAGMLARLFGNLADRITGPMKFRLVLQPIVAGLFAVRAGIRDARTGRPPYLWTLFKAGRGRGDLVREAWEDVGRVFVVAIFMDFAYQLLVPRWFYPLETAIVALVLAFVPYILLRGPATRVVRWLTGVKGLETRR